MKERKNPSAIITSEDKGLWLAYTKLQLMALCRITWLNGLSQHAQRKGENLSGHKNYRKLQQLKTRFIYELLVVKEKKEV